VIATDNAKVIARSDVIGEGANAKGDIECRGLMLSDTAEIDSRGGDSIPDGKRFEQGGSYFGDYTRIFECGHHRSSGCACAGDEEDVRYESGEGDVKRASNFILV